MEYTDMKHFELEIYQGNQGTLPKWVKQGSGNDWQKYTKFYCQGAENVIGLDLTEFWKGVLTQKQTQVVKNINVIETIGNYRNMQDVTVPFKVSVKVTY